MNLESIRETMRLFQEQDDDRQKVFLLHPWAFNEVVKELQKIFPDVIISGGKVKFGNTLIMEHKLLPEGSVLEIDLDEAEKLLGYRLKL